jgi:hypothetical protein
MIRVVVLLTAMHLRGGKEGGTPIDYSKWNGLLCSSSGDSDSSNSDCAQHGIWPGVNSTIPKSSNELPKPLHEPSFPTSSFDKRQVSAICMDKSSVAQSQTDRTNRSQNVLLASRPLVHSSKRRKYVFKNRVVSCHCYLSHKILITHPNSIHLCVQRFTSGAKATRTFTYTSHCRALERSRPRCSVTSRIK